MIALISNRQEYFNDLAEEIRLFCFAEPVREAEAVEEGETGIFVELSRQEDHCFAAARSGSCEGTCTMKWAGDDVLSVKRIEKRCSKSAVYALMRKLHPEVSAPWGSLTGIRPTKLFRDLTVGGGEEEALRQFRNVFDVSEGKTELAREICHIQQPYLDSVKPDDIDIYVGIPFCKTRCLYCSFASEVVGKKDTLSPYLEKLHADIRAGGEMVKKYSYHVRSIYFGGGTPTVLSEEKLDELLTLVLDTYTPASGEITVEAGRPDTITREKLRIMKRHGVSRISINPQTMNDETLRVIGRLHTSEEIRACYQMAREEGFDCINMDLIAGLPGETYEDFVRSLRAVAEMNPENLTVHSLALKRSSRLKAHLDEYPMQSSDVVSEMIDAGLKTAKSIGLQPYYLYRQKYMSGNLENVGYSRPGLECMYNIDMMEETTNILAHGGCAISKRLFPEESRVERIADPKEVRVYLEKLPQLLEEKDRLFAR